MQFSQGFFPSLSFSLIALSLAISGITFGSVFRCFPLLLLSPHLITRPNVIWTRDLQLWIVDDDGSHLSIPSISLFSVLVHQCTSSAALFRSLRLSCIVSAYFPRHFIDLERCFTLSFFGSPLMDTFQTVATSLIFSFCRQFQFVDDDDGDDH